MNIHQEYCEIAENLRVVDTGKSKYKIVRDAYGGDCLWHIETDHGALPVALRDKKYTRDRYALEDIKKYLAGAPQRTEIYSTKRKKEEA